MNLGIRARLIALLILVTLPILAAGWIVVQVIDDRLSDRIETDLANVRRLEAARIADALDNYQRDATSLAMGPHVQEFATDLHLADLGRLPEDATIGGVDGFSVIDPDSPRPLDELAAALQRKAATTGAEVVELSIVSTGGEVWGQTSGFSWDPYDPTVVPRVVGLREVLFGNAFRTDLGDERLAVVAPIIDTAGGAVGALVLEMRLEPITALAVEHEGFGDTSEAHLAQPTAAGDAEFITLLRFERDAAFSKIVPAENNLPINQSLRQPTGTVLRSPDYRATDSILAIETIEQTGWGLVVKIDADEAFAPIARARSVVAVATVATVLIALIGWTVLLRPLGGRLRRAAKAAEQVASGRHRQPIDDRAGDEIGAMSRSIDRLAADLQRDGLVRAEVEARLRHQATHDELTGLYNRQQATESIERLFNVSSQHFYSSILFIDLDGFKDVNDAYGHPIGDEILVAVSNRLSTSIDATATAARWGGDEFVILLPDVDEEAASAVTNRLRSLFERPVSTSVGQHVVRCSIGQSTWLPGRSVEECLSEADMGMLADKQSRTGKKRTVSPAIVRMVESALHDDRFDVWYQPLVTAAGDGRVDAVGVEALVRLRTLEGGLVLPVAFIPAIQESHLGTAVDRHVIATGLRTVDAWLRDGVVDEGFVVSFNVGAASLRDPDLPTFLTAALQRTLLAPESIILEISETAAGVAAGQLEALRRCGVLVAVDDVGISHSNVDRLAEFRPDVAKIDRRWLKSSASDPASGALLRELVQICRVLGMRVIAEGVETQDHVDVLRALHVTEFQGFYFAGAMVADDFAASRRAQQTQLA